MKIQGLLLFDIDGVIRNVSGSYRLAIQETVKYFSGWEPTIEDIDDLKSEGIWNNDWHVSLELIKRKGIYKSKSSKTPDIKEVTSVFSNYYFGGDPNGDSDDWNGYIKNEPLLVNKSFFDKIKKKNFIWGFVSGAEQPSARFVLEKRLSLLDPPLIAMGDAPEKPDPTGFIKLATELLGAPLGGEAPPIGYLGDTVADVITVMKARDLIPNQKFISLGVAPPHLHKKDKSMKRKTYEQKLLNAGADIIIPSTMKALKEIDLFLEI